ncbi:MAG: S24 family peptidase [Bacteroidales bacterium]|nr:S24 family peptidase [Bacteroidales bacterium]
MGNILSRIEEISRKEGLTITAFERSIGASKGVLSRAINNGTDIQSKWIQTIVENYPHYSSRWLLTGKGDMLIQPTKKNEENFSENPKNSSSVSFDPSIGVPYYDVDFIGGFSEVFNSQTTVPACNIVAPGFEKASVWCNVTGHSMEPKINHGDIVALRRCTVQDIQYGEIYAVVLDSFRTIKILRRGSTPDVLRYVPINRTDFDDQEFPLSRILHVFEVLGSIARFF